MHITRRLFVPVLTAVLGLAATSVANAAGASPATGLPGFQQVVVDKAAGHIFVSEGAGKGVAVTDLTGTLLTTLDPGTGVNGIALSADGTELYAAIPGTDAVAEIDASSLQQAALYPLGSGDVPYFIAIQSGKVWVSYQEGSLLGTGAIGDITPGEQDSFEADPSLLPPVTNFWYGAPNLAADPLDSGSIVAVQESMSPGSVVSLSVSATPRVLAWSGSFTACDSSIATPAVMPGGAQFAVPCRTGMTDILYSTADLSAQSKAYLSAANPNAIAVSPSGAVATGASQFTSTAPDTFTFLPGETSSRNSYTFAGSQTILADNGLAWSADDSILAAVYGPQYGPYSLQVINDPLQWTSQLTLGGQSGAAPNQPITLHGTLSFSGGTPPAGTPIAIARTQPGSSAASVQLTAATRADGSFTVSDSPLPVGTYAYTASYAGGSELTASTASSTVTVTLATSALSLSGPASARPGEGFSLSGSLSFEFGAPSNGQPVKVVRINPNGTATIFSTTTGMTGSFSVTDKISTMGTYSYTASYAGGPGAGPAKPVAFKVTVAKARPILTLSAGAPTQLYASTIHVTVHLGSTYSNRTVSVYYQLVPSATRKLPETAKVNSGGNLVLSYRDATRNVTFTVAFGGDAQYLASSVRQRVNVAMRVAMTNSGWYTSTSHDGTTFRVFHHTGHLNVAVTVTPNRYGGHLNLVVQQLWEGSWTLLPQVTYGFTLRSSSIFSGYLTLADATGGYYRIRAAFVPSSKDVTNVGNDSGWFYFSVVK